MDILAAIKREERGLEKQLGKLNHHLSDLDPLEGVTDEYLEQPNEIAADALVKWGYEIRA